MKRIRPVLLGALAAVLLAAVAGTFLVLVPGPEAEAAGEALPLPPEIPRLDDSPQYEECLGLLRRDPDGAASFAEGWEAAGGGEGARHCGALALLALGETERGAERLEQLARASQASAPARAAVFAQAVQAWMLANQSGRAFAAATMGLTIAPDDLDLMTDRAVALGTLGRYQDALQDLERVLATDPDRAEAWVFRAAALRRLDRVDQAAAAVDRALRLAPDSAEALLERGIIRQLRGDTAGARADWQRAIALAPDSATADLAQQNLALNEAGPQRR
ncbi:tetratricopeptide repeat protein [Paracraurococcus lichenis]|uniref:Tetratricopeptide repeat protein n=1 Tax=Paracraurococcus lichenis TaxID=3064888 RepID=A0ABT9E6A2_9PROT|nr:tetratricopeptide repeat protein [Paracraurococcus sp. LOR1-02]MDO9711642.1 tetratricopeptide repeat protein [Paracraurococcus sp. LOR1-02]